VNLDGGVRGQLPVLPALPGARVLSLRSNRLVNMETGAFVQLPSLTTLDLSWNQLSGEQSKGLQLKLKTRSSRR
jgi:hypothetical protein